MTSPAPNLLPPDRALSETTLAISLGTRSVGLAAGDREHLLSYAVVDLHKLCSREAKEDRFRKRVLRLADTFSPHRIALVEPVVDSDLIGAERAWLNTLAGERALDVAAYERAVVKAAVIRPVERPSHRRVAKALAERFPELWHLTSAAEPVPGAEHVVELAACGRRTPSSREIYYRPLFLSVAAVVHDLTELALRRLDS